MAKRRHQLVLAHAPDHQDAARRLFLEYHDWLDLEVEQRYGAEIDLCGLHSARPAESDDYRPPRGRLILAELDGTFVGIGALRPVDSTVGEIKHMYVQPEARGRGLARSLLERLISEAREIGYQSVRLDTTEFMTAAHSLYRSVGFQQTEPYGDSARATRFGGMLLFMELDLASPGL